MEEQTDPLFALSIEQPWLEMILRGEKTIEVRSRMTKRRGYIALHAPWKIDFSAAYLFGFERPWFLSRGGIVGAAEITGVRELDGSSSLTLLHQHRQALPVGGGFYGYELRNVMRFERLIKCRGSQGFFPLPEKLARSVREKIRIVEGPELRSADR